MIPETVCGVSFVTNIFPLCKSGCQNGGPGELGGHYKWYSLETFVQSVDVLSEGHCSPQICMWDPQVGEAERSVGAILVGNG